MKNLIFALFCLVFTLNATANCLPAYEDNIELRLQNLKQNHSTAVNSTAGTFIGVTGVFSYFGVVLVGPWGLLIGPQFGFFAAAPIGAGFYVYSKAKLYGLNQRAMVYTVLHEAINKDGVNTKHYNDTFNALKTRYKDLNQDKFDDILISLNDSKELCDGTIAQYRKYRLFRRRTLATYKDLWAYLWDKTGKLMNSY